MADFTYNIRSNNRWFSSPFFTFTRGHKVVLKLSINQTSSNPMACIPLEEAYNSTLIVNLHLMKGPYDDELQKSGHWPMRGEFKIEILNQCHSSQLHNYTFQLNKDICSRCVQRVKVGSRSRHSWKVRLTNIFQILKLLPLRCVINDRIYFILE